MKLLCKVEKLLLQTAIISVRLHNVRTRTLWQMKPVVRHIVAQSLDQFGIRYKKAGRWQDLNPAARA